MVVRGERSEPADVQVLDHAEAGTRLSMVLREGRKREVRRLWQALGYPVLDLQRVRLDGLQLGDLAEGEVRALRSDEVARLKSAAGPHAWSLPSTGPPVQERPPLDEHWRGRW